MGGHPTNHKHGSQLFVPHVVLLGVRVHVFPSAHGGLVRRQVLAGSASTKTREQRPAVVLFVPMHITVHETLVD